LPIAGTGSIALTLGTSSLIMSGTDGPVQARALDDGRVLWTAKVETDDRPVIESGLVIGTSAGRMHAIDEASGETRWTIELGGPTRGVSIRQGRILVSAGNELRAYRVADGAPLWSQNTGAAALTRPSLTDAVVVLALDDHSLAAFTLENGRPIWRERIQVTPLSAVASGDRVYVGAAEGYACAYKLQHGRMDWCYPVRVRPIGEPVVEGRFVYFSFLDNMVHVFDRQNGRRQYTPTLTYLPTGGPVLTPTQVAVPVVTGEIVLLELSNPNTITRVSRPSVSELPSMKAAAIAPDGAILAMVIAAPGFKDEPGSALSPTGRLAILFRREVVPPPAPPADPAQTVIDLGPPPVESAPPANPPPTSTRPTVIVPPMPPADPASAR
jgi:outer membrane protein assembly factor BamB